MAVFSIGIVIDVFVFGLEFPLPLLPKWKEAAIRITPKIWGFT
jgi:hypothetical protein